MTFRAHFSSSSSLRTLSALMALALTTACLKNTVKTKGLEGPLTPGGDNVIPKPVEKNNPGPEAEEPNGFSEDLQSASPFGPSLVRKGFEKIFGDNELTVVTNDGANVDAHLKPLVNAFGRISMGCTGTYIGDNLVITAGHCFAPDINAGLPKTSGPTLCKNPQTGLPFTVAWGYRTDAKAYLTSSCVNIEAAELNNDVDYAIFRIDTPPPVKVQVSLDRAPVGTKMTIFGHPQGRPLEWSKYCTLNGFDRNLGPNSTAAMFHQCDTEPGNSGSTILDAQSGVAFAIHDGGIENVNNYGTLLANTPLKSLLKTVTPVSLAGATPTPTPTPTASPNPTSPTAPSSPSPGAPSVPVGPGGTDPFPLPGPTEGFDVFKDLHNSEERALFESVQGPVSFELKSATEKGFDYVYVKDGKGTTARYSGQQWRRFKNLQAPVILRFVSDGTNVSSFVAVKKL